MGPLRGASLPIPPAPVGTLRHQGPCLQSLAFNQHHPYVAETSARGEGQAYERENFTFERFHLSEAVSGLQALFEASF